MEAAKPFQYRKGFYWRIYKFEGGEIEVIPMNSWSEFDYDQDRFLTLKLFDTKEDAETFLEDFWTTYWRLCSI